MRYNSDMSHHSMTCISQLASLNGAVFPDDKAKLEYLVSFVSGFLELLSRYYKLVVRLHYWSCWSPILITFMFLSTCLSFYEIAQKVISREIPCFIHRWMMKYGTHPFRVRVKCQGFYVMKFLVCPSRLLSVFKLALLFSTCLAYAIPIGIM